MVMAGRCSSKGRVCKFYFLFASCFSAVFLFWWVGGVGGVVGERRKDKRDSEIWQWRREGRPGFSCCYLCSHLSSSLSSLGPLSLSLPNCYPA